jgi:hypothetical protein
VSTLAWRYAVVVAEHLWRARECVSPDPRGLEVALHDATTDGETIPCIRIRCPDLCSPGIHAFPCPHVLAAVIGTGGAKTRTMDSWNGWEAVSR